jgi:hypothetical protein
LTLEEAALAISKLHPWFCSPEKSAVECAQAIERVSARRSMGLSAAAEHVRARTEAYAASPKGRRRDKFSKTSPRWFADGCYDDNPATWEEREPGSHVEHSPLPNEFVPASARLRRAREVELAEMEHVGGLA